MARILALFLYFRALLDGFLDKIARRPMKSTISRGIILATGKIMRKFENFDPRKVLPRVLDT